MLVILGLVRDKKINFATMQNLELSSNLKHICDGNVENDDVLCIWNLHTFYLSKLYLLYVVANEPYAYLALSVH